MNRLLPLLRWELVRQFRQGLYYAGAFVVAVWVILLSQLPEVARSPILVMVLFLDLSVFGFFFMAGLLYLEKGEGVLHALVVTPMRAGEYLLTKVVSLSLLTLLVSVGVTLAVHGAGFDWVILLVGVVMNAMLFTLASFILAARYDAINEFIIPAVLFGIVTQLPLLHIFGIWQHPLLYLFPSMPPLLMLKAAFEAIPSWQMLYAVLYSALWIAICYAWAQRIFANFITRAEGARA